MGGSRDDLARIATRAFQAVEQANHDVRSIEDLAQVCSVNSNNRNAADGVLAVEDDTRQSKRTVEEISKAYNSPC